MDKKNKLEILTHFISTEDINLSAEELSSLSSAINKITSSVNSYRKSMDTEPQWLKLAKVKSDSILNKKIEKPLNLLGAIEDMLNQLKVPVTQFFRNKDLKDLSEEELFELYSDLKNLTDEKKDHE